MIKGNIEMANGEIIEFELYEDKAPNTVENFVKLTKNKFYDGLTFHRVIRGFVSQGGCPNGDGTGELDYLIKNEDNDLKHIEGSMAMAHRGKDTASCQFYICHAPQPHLDGGYTVFGQVTKNMEAVKNMFPGDKISKIVVFD